MSEFKHQPSIQVLQALVSASFTELNNLNKAVRLWYTLRELGVEFQPAQFTDRSWREHLYESPDRNRDNKPEQIDGCLCTKTIADILFDRAQDRADLWSNWKLSLRESLIEYYGARDLPEIADRKLADYLIALELEKPFDVTGKTILGDLKTLAQIPKTSANKYLISIGTSEFQLPDEFPPTLVETQHIDRSRLIISAEEPRSLQDPAYLTGDFSSLAYLFAEPTRASESRGYGWSNTELSCLSVCRTHQGDSKISHPCRLSYATGQAARGQSISQAIERKLEQRSKHTMSIAIL
jgi:hypothetical protein